jgi:hypothetical protein
MSAKNVVPIGIRSPDCPARNEWDQRKVKWCRYRPGVAQRVGRGIALLFHDRDTRRVWVVSSTPSRTLPPGKNGYPFDRRLGGPQGRSGRAENLVPTGIRSRTLQLVAQSLNRLSYPAHCIGQLLNNVLICCMCGTSGGCLPCRLNICSNQNCFAVNWSSV